MCLEHVHKPQHVSAILRTCDAVGIHEVNIVWNAQTYFRKGTAMGTRKGPEPMFCLKVLAMFRFVCRDAEIRASGGREVNLRNLQGLALFPANSMFLGDYLTTDGQPAAEDLQMIKDLGFEVAQPRG